jgi:cardiolipin synthase
MANKGMSLANRITILRVVLVPVFVMAMLYHRLDVAFFVFLAASATDALDGYLARAFGQVTSFGTLMDPVADKLLVASAFLAFSLLHGLPLYLKMPIYVPLIVISRDIIILIGVMAIYFLTGKLEVKPTMLGKLTTCFQMATILALLLKFVYSSWLWNITAAVTMMSGLDYIRIGMRQVNGKA